MGMGKQAPLGIKMEIKVHQMRGSNRLIYPLNVDPTGPVASPSNRVDETRPFRQWIPWLIPVFVVINVIVFVLTMYFNNCPKNYGSCFAPFLGRFAFQPRRQNAMLGPSPATLEKMGALDVNKVIHGHQGWRLITCNWLHAGVIHILANMLSLLFIGIRLEQDFGFAKIGLLYVISGFGGSLMSALFLTSSDISVGASGALFGLLGSMLSELLINWSIYVHKFAALFILVFIIVINLGVGLFPHVDNFAHIGGFISGFLLGFIFLIRPQFGWIRQQIVPGFHSGPVKPKHTLYQYMYWILAVILLIAWFIGGVVLLYQGINVNDHCSWCHYLSCLPTSKWRCRTSAS